MVRKILKRVREKAVRFDISFGLLRQDLSSILALADSTSDLGTKAQWLESLLDWVRISVNPESQKTSSKIQAVRFRYLLKVLEKNPKWEKEFSKLLSGLLLETDALSLLCETGLSNQNGFISECIDRIVHRIVPVPRNEKDLGELFVRLFDDETDADWLATLDESTIQRLEGMIFSDPEAKQYLLKKYTKTLLEALVILAAQVESAGLSKEIRFRSHIRSVRDSAFFRLRMIMALAHASLASDETEKKEAILDRMRPHFDACRKEINNALQHLEEHGVSTTIVYRLERIERQLDRMELISEILFAKANSQKSTLWLRLMASLIRSSIESSSVRKLFQDNLHMLARKVVERVGVSGERYITSTKKEYFSLLLSAGGGGMVTAGTAYVKFLIGKTNPALFFEGLFSSINYTFSFLLMQICHFTLATKQPSVTAHALASKLKEIRQESDLAAFNDTVAKLTRSQFAAAVGNIGIVAPVAIIADFLFSQSFGRHIMPIDYATKVIAEMHPWKSPTIIFAFGTGVLLWLSGLGAGWLENWFVYRRLPETISQSPVLINFLGAKKAARVSDWICKNIAGIGGNVSLGILLAFSPIIGQFFGLPFHTRHVTISSGGLFYAYSAMPSGALNWQDYLLGAISVVLVGLLNFGVSFALALYTAIRARDVKKGRLVIIRHALWKHIRANPLAYFWPQASKQAAHLK
ncbi:MAG: site-specific recombinase [Oligoflexia bacterium]|nr:site-specific recombinase [Oligoflexia bacterium]